MADLKPCPFCGGTDTRVRENGRVWIGMKYGEPSSVSILHWCPAEPGQPSRVLERVGRDLASAVAAWNRRAGGAPAIAIHASREFVVNIANPAQPLTNDEIDQIAADGMRNAAGGIYATSVHEFARAVEARVRGEGGA
jgi:hypothetical protein